MLSGARSGPKLAKGMDRVWDWGRGWVQRALPRRRRFLRRAARIVGLEARYVHLADARLREQIEQLRALFRRGRDQPEHLDQAFALIREVAFRRLGERPYLVQVAAALALEGGCVAELATGEGKTLTATLPATVAGWRGRGCHIVTVNDYLARRDAEWMQPIYEFCGVSAGFVTNALAPPQRRAAYEADVTYTTNKEVTADFLRDRLVLGRRGALSDVLLEHIAGGGAAARPGTAAAGVWQRLVLRGLNQAIVDEADSILIDEAVTPLIISGGGPNAEQLAAYRTAAEVAAQLAPAAHYRVDHRYRDVELTAEGRGAAEEATRALGGLWHGSRRREELLTQALTARELYQSGKQYVVSEGKVVIVDEFTGRLMPDRTWRDGLHQAVEAKEGIEVTPVKETLARVSFQRFFRLYRKLSGMTGTAAEAWPELWRTYHLPVVVIPTHRPCIRAYAADRIHADGDSRWEAVVQEIERVHATGRPILVGTRSVNASERLSQGLAQRGLEHQVLNAVRHEQEAQVVLAAGQPGRITVATNMAGRGTDIKLGQGVAERGGLHVIATERHESGRIDRQLFGRCARQGDPGSAAAFAALDDELTQRYAPRWLKLLAGRGRRGPLPGWAARALVHRAQKRAERMARAQRAQVLRTDDWLDEFLGFAGAQGW